MPAKRLAASRAALQGFGGSSSASLQRKDAETLLQKLCEPNAAAGASVEVSFECARCLNVMSTEEAQIIQTCRHHYCDTCADLAVLDSPSTCLLCKMPFDRKDLISVKAATTLDSGSNPAQGTTTVSDFHASGTTATADDASETGGDAGPKVAALVEAVGALPRGEKLVAFSSFVEVLEAAKQALVGVESVVFSGQLSQSDRRKVLTAFGGVDGPTVLLCSLKAGGVGLDFTRANHAYLLDSWWNAATEEQALARVHRIGQTRSCTCVRLVAERTVEERIVELQKAKSALAQDALADHVGGERMETIKLLFEPFED